MNSELNFNYFRKTMSKLNLLESYVFLKVLVHYKIMQKLFTSGRNTQLLPHKRQSLINIVITCKPSPWMQVVIILTVSNKNRLFTNYLLSTASYTFKYDLSLPVCIMHDITAILQWKLCRTNVCDIKNKTNRVGWISLGSNVKLK